jgi:hypothetical protein
MKRLRYLLWALCVCITDEIEPSPCDSIKPMAHPDCIASNCSCRLCNIPDGHSLPHRNDLTGVEWWYNE